MPSSDPPPAPDYIGAANAQGSQNLKAAIATGIMNNPNVTNPYGSQTVTWEYEKDKNGKVIRAIPTINQELSPEQQALYEQGLVAKGNLANTLTDLTGGLNLGQVDFSGAPTVGDLNAPNARYFNAKGLNAPNQGEVPEFGSLDSSEKYRQDVIDAMMSRVETDTAKQRSQKNSELIAAGLRPGTKAYEDAMDQIGRQYNDAQQQAILAGGSEATRSLGMDQAAIQQEIQNYLTGVQSDQAYFGMDATAAQQAANDYLTGVQGDQAYFGMESTANQADMQARQQAIAEYLQARQTPINEINALMTGTQIDNPFAGGLGFQGGANVQPAPIAQAVTNQGTAAQNLWNTQQAGTNSNIAAGAGLIGSLGSAAMYY